VANAKPGERQQMQRQKKGNEKKTAPINE